jgi:hypothetical protein
VIQKRCYSVYFHAEINTWGYPQAALFGCWLALGADNVLAVGLAALRGVHGQQKIDPEVSLYYVANAIATTYTGMMMAIPEPAWGVFATMSTLELAKRLVNLAQYVRLEALRKSPTRARKTRSNPKRSSKQGHVSTAKLLELFRNKRQGKLSSQKAMEGANRWVCTSETIARCKP